MSRFLSDLGGISNFLPRSDRVSIPKSMPSDDVDFLASPRNVKLALQIIAAYTARMKDALSLYRPLPGAATAFHASLARTRLISGSNQAGKASRTDEPVLTPDGWRTMGDLKVGDRVIGGDGNPCNVIGVFPQGEKDVYRLHFCDGATTRCCNEHLWKITTPKNRFGKNRGVDKWEVRDLKSIRDEFGDNPAPLSRIAIPVAVAQFDAKEVPLDPYLLGMLLGDGGMSTRSGVVFSTADSELVDILKSRMPQSCRLRKTGSCDYHIAGEVHGRNDLLNITRLLGLQGKKSFEKFVPKDYLFNSVEVRLGVLRGLMDTDGSVGDRRDKGQGGTCEYGTTSPQLADDVITLVRSLGGKAKIVWRKNKYTYKGEKKTGRWSARIRIRLPGFNPFLMKRKAERYKPAASTTDHRLLYRVEPAGRGECVCIAVDSPDHTYVTNDFIVTHNTLTAEAEFARIARGKDPYNKRARSNLKMMAVGKDLSHVGQVMWRKLHWTGAFEIIIDQETGFYRSVRPDPRNPQVVDPSDLARRAEWMPAPPIIPASDIAGMSWESKGEGIPSIVHMTNGTEIMFRTSKGEPPNGIQLDVIHFDEEIENRNWYPEMVPRMARYGGMFFWSATPQAQTPQFFTLHERCVAGEPGIEEFALLIENNPYLDAEAKEAMRLDLLAMGEDEYAVRWLGKYAIQGRQVYPTYDQRIHGIAPLSDEDTKDWMLLVVLDPGSTMNAFAIMGVPPSADRLVVLEECEIKNKDAAAVAAEVKRRLRGRRPEAYVIDYRAGRQTSIGRNDSVVDHYVKEFKKAGVPPAAINGVGFVWGCDIPEAREMSVKRLLNASPPRLQFVSQRTASMDRQVRGRYYDKNDGNRREKRTVHDLCDVLEYGAAFFDETGLYHKPPPAPVPLTTAYDERLWRSLQEKKRKGWRLN
jgi:hypothetical protein